MAEDNSQPKARHARDLIFAHYKANHFQPGAHNSPEAIAAQTGLALSDVHAGLQLLPMRSRLSDKEPSERARHSAAAIIAYSTSYLQHGDEISPEAIVEQTGLTLSDVHAGLQLLRVRNKPRLAREKLVEPSYNMVVRIGQRLPPDQAIATAERLGRIKQLRGLLNLWQVALERRLDPRVVNEEQQAHAAAWAADMVDRLWEKREGGQRRKLEAMALMTALDEAKNGRLVLAHLDRSGHFVMAWTLRDRTDEIASAWEAWKNKKRGANKTGIKRKNKWDAVGELAGLDGEGVRKLWKDLKREPKQGQ